MRNKTFISSMVGIAAAVAVAGSAHAGVTVYRNFASWSAIADTEVLGTETFSSFNGDAPDYGLSGAVGGAQWSVNTPFGVKVTDGVVSAVQAGVLYFNFSASGGISGVAGNFSGYQIQFGLSSGWFDLNLNNSAPMDFWAIHFDQGSILSMNVYQSGPPRVDNLSFMTGGFIPPIPAPGTFAAIGLAACLTRRRRG
jgi:hypothetical protein